MKKILVAFACSLMMSNLYADWSPNQVSAGKDGVVGMNYLGAGWTLGEDLKLKSRLGFSQTKNSVNTIGLGIDLLKPFKTAKNYQLYYGGGYALSRSDTKTTDALYYSYVKAVVGIELTFTEFENISFNFQSGLSARINKNYQFGTFAENPFSAEVTYHF